jgi:hypothetical protein
MDDCSYSIVFIVFYFVALIFVMKTHFHYIGYILLLIVYLVNILYIMMKNTDFSNYINGFLIPNQFSILSQNTGYKSLLFMIVFFTLYSLVRMVDTYNYLIGKYQTYDIPLTIYHKNNVYVFNVSFVVATVLLMGLLMLMSMGVGLNKWVLWGVPLVSFVFVGLQFAYSYAFSGMKYDFVRKQGSKL